MGIRIRQKHIDLVMHYQRFIGKATSPTLDEVRAFIEWESTGKAVESVNIDHLLQAKKLKELTIKMIYEEVFYYWSQWAYWPEVLESLILQEVSDKIYQDNLSQILETLVERGVESVLRSHSEFSETQKQRWLKTRIDRLNERLEKPRVRNGYYLANLSQVAFQYEFYFNSNLWC